MNRINFAKTTTGKRSCTNPWARKGSLVLCLFILAAVSSIQIVQWKTLHGVKQEKEMRMKRIASLDKLLSEKTSEH